jgi:uncharacterized iron-regulated protein
MIKQIFIFTVGTLLTSCATLLAAPPIPSQATIATTESRLSALPPADILLLGEQHDAKDHQQIHQQVIAALVKRSGLAALALEMADAGTTTADLQADSNEQQVKNALNWNEKAWPWAAYGPIVMTAVRAGVPVLGANLPREQMRLTMSDGSLDFQLPEAALKAQQLLIRSGHCNLLPENQITPMTRIQIARDISMANTLIKAVVPGKLVVLVSGSGHADRTLGVPRHLPSNLKVSSVLLSASGASVQKIGDQNEFDVVWITPALPTKDYCAQFKSQMGIK